MVGRYNGQQQFPKCIVSKVVARVGEWTSLEEKTLTLPFILYGRHPSNLGWGSGKDNNMITEEVGV